MINTHIPCVHRRSYCLTIFILCLGLQSTLWAQGTFKPGDKVMASPSMLKDDKYYRPCTVSGFTAGAYVLDCGGTEYVVQPAYVRPGQNTGAGVKDPVPPKEPGMGSVRLGGGGNGFKVGDRVLASVSGLKGDKYYQPCTVTKGLKDGAYSLKCDPHNGLPFMDYSVRPEWIKAWAGATRAPEQLACPFKKDYAPVSNRAPASAALFQSVIFEWRQSTSDFYDFGITFSDSKVGPAFKNVVTGPGRKKSDTAPLGATIYPFKTKELMCQKSSTITKRFFREIAYDCFKNDQGEWVCKQGAPKDIEPPTSIENQ
jgi:hypothetical protein